MSTVIIQIQEPAKAEALVRFLQSIDYISKVEVLDKYINARRLLEEINRVAAQTALSQMTMEEIDAEVNAYRRGE